MEHLLKVFLKILWKMEQENGAFAQSVFENIMENIMDYVFENIMENGAFDLLSKCSIFHNSFKSIQNFTSIFLEFFNLSKNRN